MLGIGVGRRRTGKGERKPNGDTAGGRDEQVDAILSPDGIGEADALPDADEARVAVGDAVQTFNLRADFGKEGRTSQVFAEDHG